MRKPYRKDWDGEDILIESPSLLSIKLDGVCCIIDRELGYCVSRNGKPLLHTGAIYDHYKYTHVERGEIYLGDFKTTISRVKSFAGTDLDPIKEFYPHTPIHQVDWRICLWRYYSGETVTAAELNRTLSEVTQGQHYEGLVLLSTDGDLIKFKPKPTYDLLVIGINEGTGKNVGRLGSLVTEKGKVGIGFSDQERIDFWKDVPKMIEVEAMGLTASGKLRHPRFIRVRGDK